MCPVREVVLSADAAGGAAGGIAGGVWGGGSGGLTPEELRDLAQRLREYPCPMICRLEAANALELFAATLEVTPDA